jgi:hypothetical protein
VKVGGRRSGEKQMVPEADFGSYYGRPVLKETVWGPDIPSYLFLGGLAGASSALAAAAQLSGHPELARASRPARPERSACRWWRWCTTSADPPGLSTCCE